MTAEIPREPGRVPVGELRELVKRWESLAKNPASGGIMAGCCAKHAEELEAVIGKYERTREKIRCDKCGKPEFESWDAENEAEGLCTECRYEA